MEINERILLIVKEKGPLLPVQVAKEINDNILMASARLSELLTSKHIKISNVKVGGSPLYYFQGQETKLQNFSNNLQQKEKEAYELLKQNRILRDSLQEPSIRVALRQIRDFAVPLQVDYNRKTEVFWKWYLAESSEVQTLISNSLSKGAEEVVEKTAVKEEAKKPAEVQKATEKIEEGTQKELGKDITKKSKKPSEKGTFLKEISRFFNRSSIAISETKEIKNNSEIDFVLEISTSIGHVKYFCKAKSKKKINESDLSMAFVQAQSKNLPLLFLTKGGLTKKAKEMLKNEFKNILLREL